MALSEDAHRKLIYRAHAWMEQLKGEQRPDQELLEEMRKVSEEYASNHDLLKDQG